MRIVLDTNVLVSAALKRQSMPGMAANVIERRGGLLKSLATEHQLFEVVARPYLVALIDPDTQAWLKELMAAAELVAITERIAACRDPTDDKFLELGIVHERHITGSVRASARHPAFRWANTMLANVKNSLLAAHRVVGAKHLPRYLGAFAWRFNRRFVLKTIHERLAIAATTTPPMPYRLLKLAEARW